MKTKSWEHTLKLPAYAKDSTACSPTLLLSITGSSAKSAEVEHNLSSTRTNSDLGDV